MAPKAGGVMQCKIAFRYEKRCFNTSIHMREVPFFPFVFLLLLVVLSVCFFGCRISLWKLAPYTRGGTNFRICWNACGLGAMASGTTEYDLVLLTGRTGTTEYRFGTIGLMANNMVAQVARFSRLAKSAATDSLP